MNGYFSEVNALNLWVANPLEKIALEPTCTDCNVGTQKQKITKAISMWRATHRFDQPRCPRCEFWVLVDDQNWNGKILGENIARPPTSSLWWSKRPPTNEESNCDQNWCTRLGAPMLLDLCLKALALISSNPMRSMKLMLRGLTPKRQREGWRHEAFQIKPQIACMHLPQCQADETKGKRARSMLTSIGFQIKHT